MLVPDLDHELLQNLYVFSDYRFDFRLAENLFRVLEFTTILLK